MKRDLTLTFQDLGDANSRNLGFPHRSGVSVTYGEETITKTDLLEIRWRHFRGGVIPRAIRWPCRYGVSCRDLE